MKAGLVDGVKAHNGGFRLARPAEDTTVLEILTAVEGSADMDSRCAFGFENCTPHMPCPLHPTFEKLKHHLSGWASEHSLRDLAGATAPPQP